MAPPRSPIFDPTSPPPPPPRSAPAVPAYAWRAVGWFGLVLFLIGLGQVVIYLLPATGFGAPEWEFVTAAQMLASLPLPTMGLGAMLAAALAQGSRRTLVALAILCALLALCILGALVLFWLVVPVALRNTPEIAGGTLRQTIARTTLSGLGFGLLYLGTTIGIVRFLRRRRAD